ncbi:MAG: Mut7-C RNAse domain-containing protein [Anaerolineaceae bacterium]
MQVFLRFYAELNDFLPYSLRQRLFTLETPPHNTVKHIIESLGVPHTEIDLILADGAAVDFSYRPINGERISVYPAFQRFDISPLARLRAAPLREVRFIADTHLGKLVVYLRMLGFDTLYSQDFTDPQIAETAAREGRIVLTRDRGLLKRNLVTHGLYVHATQPRLQTAEVVQRLKISAAMTKPFTRCLACNHLLEAIDKQHLAGRLPPNTEKYYDSFQHCPGCGRIYWKGSHYQKMQKFIEEVLA